MKKQSFADILNAISDADFARMAKKVPEWSGIQGMCYPTRLCMEQCSSSETALYKAEICRRISSGLSHKPGIADLTGGLGVDCWAFSTVAEHVHHNEMDKELHEAVCANFELLGIRNSSFSNMEIKPGMIADVFPEGWAPDIIFLDPARRNDIGKKVFLLEDCRPDVLTMKDELLGISPDVLVKLSPMADITMVCARLGQEVREVHIVSADGECKELLVWMHRGWDGGFSIHVGNFVFRPEEEKSAVPAFCEDESMVSGYLFEPSSALLKSGAFNLLCSRCGLMKLGRFTHLYVSKECDHGLDSMGKWFSIREVHQFDGRTIKAVGHDFPRCEVTARNIPMSSEELKKKMGVTSGGSTHIFAFSADFAKAGSRRLILVTEKI